MLSLLKYTALIGALSWMSLPVAASTYAYSTIQYPGALGTFPLSINSSGTVAGYFYDAGLNGHGFTYAGGVYTQIDAGSSCYSTFVTGINDAGAMSGYCWSTGIGTLNFIDKDGSFSYYGIKNIADTYTGQINNKNFTVGYLYSNVDSIASFFAANATVVKVFAAPGPATSAFGINNLNIIVGSGIEGDTGKGFIAEDNNYTYFSYPGSSATFFNGVNDSMQIVGYERKAAGGPVTAFSYANGVYTDLAIPGASASVASGVNNEGVITGYAIAGSGNINARAAGFIATPQP